MLHKKVNIKNLEAQVWWGETDDQPADNRELTVCW